MSRDHWTAEEYKEYQRTGRMPGECVGATHSKDGNRSKQEEVEWAWAAAVARGEVMVLDIPCGPEDLRSAPDSAMSDLALAREIEQQKKRKYRNEPTVVDGIRFDSRHEAQVWEELKMRQRAGEFRGVLRQVRFDLIPGQLEYRADFVTIGNDMRVEVLDAKSEITRKDKVYVIKKKLMRERWGIEIKEV
jgi:hypothetical protein